MSFDWLLIWGGLRAFLTAGNPYTSLGFFYPPAFSLLFSPLALLPEGVGYLLLTTLTTALCLRVYGKRFVYWLAFVPVFYGLFVGNVDLLFVALAAQVQANRRGALLMALLTLKPQLALILLPALLVKTKPVFRHFLAYSALLWGIPTLFFPALTRDWLSGVMSGAYGHAGVNSAGLWSFGLPLAVTLALCLLVAIAAGKLTRTTMLLISPFGQWNGLVALIESAPLWLLSPVSLIALVASGQTGAAFWWAVVPIAAAVWQLYSSRRFVKRSLSGQYAHSQR